MPERFEDADVPIETYQRALRALSTYRYMVLSASNQLIDTDHVLDGDLVLSDRDDEHEHVLKDSANPYRLTNHEQPYQETVLQDPRRLHVVDDDDIFTDWFHEHMIRIHSLDPTGYDTESARIVAHQNDHMRKLWGHGVNEFIL